MVFIVLLLLIITFCDAKVAPIGEFYTDYNSKEKSNIIKGLFVILVFCSHYSQYVTLNGIYNEPYIAIKSHLSQMVVAMFLFYSGYGIMESITKKGFGYVKTIPYKRFLSVLLNFDIAVLLFIILQFFLGKTFGLKTIILSLIGWESVGNSNWYIFVTLVIYLLIFISLFIIKIKNNKITRIIGLFIFFILTILFVYSQMLIGRPAYTYNTAILFPLGSFYSYFKTYIDKFVMKNGFFYATVCLIIACVYFWSYNIRSNSIYTYSIWAVAFTLSVVIFTMKVSIRNPILEWFGKHIFSIYILQRIPMLILQYYGFNLTHKYEFFIVSLIATCLIAMAFDYFAGILNKRIWKA